MGSTGSLLVSRCLMFSLRSAPWNQKRIELFQKLQIEHLCVLCSEADPPPKQQCRSRNGKIVSRMRVIHTMSLLRVLAAMRISKKRTTLMPDVGQAQEGKTHFRNMACCKYTRMVLTLPLSSFSLQTSDLRLTKKIVRRVMVQKIRKYADKLRVTV